MYRPAIVALFTLGLISLSAAEPFTFDANPRELLRSPTQWWNMSISPDGRYLATAHQSGKSGTIRLWDTRTNKYLSKIVEPKDGTRFVLFHPKGKYLVSANFDSFVRVYEYPELKKVHEFKAHDAGVNGLAFDEEGLRLATAGLDNKCKVWSFPEDPSKVKLIGIAEGHTNMVMSVSLSAKGDKLASGSWDGTGRTWKIEGEKITQVARYNGHETTLEVVSFNAEATKVFSGGWDNRLHLWNAETGVRERLGTGHTRGILALTFAESGKGLVTASGDETTPFPGELRVWNDNGAFSGILGSHDDMIRGVVANKEGIVYSMGRDRVIRSWNLKNRNIIGPTMAPPPEDGEGNDPIPLAVISPDRSLLAFGSSSGEIRLVKGATGEFLGILKGHKGEILSLAFDAKSQTLASSSVDRTVQLWDISKKVSKQTIPTSNELIYAVAFTPSNQLLTAGSERKVTLWNTEGKEDKSWTSGTATLTSIAVSHDGKQLATGGVDRIIRIWNLENPKQQPVELRGHAGTIKHLAWAKKPDTLLSIGNDSQARVWNTKESEITFTYKPVNKSLTTGAISPEATYVAFGNKLGGLTIVDTATSLIKHEFVKHKGSINAVLIPSDGQSILTAGSDGTAKQWYSGEPALPPLSRLTEHKGGVTNIVLSANGERLATSGRDGKIKVYEAATKKLLKEWVAHETEIKAIAWDHEGKVLITTGSDQLVRAWTDTGDKKWEHKHPTQVNSVAVTSKEKLVAIAGDEKEILLLDLEGKEKLRIKTNTPALSMGFSLDGSELYSATDSLFVSWDIGGGKRDSRALGSFAKGDPVQITSLAVAHKADQIAFVQKGVKSTIHFTTGAGENLSTQMLPSVDDVVSVAISPSGEFVATVGRDGFVTVFDLRAKNRIRHFRAEDGPLNAIALSNDGQTLYTGGYEGVVKLWPTTQDSTLQCVAEFSGKLQISNDGKTIALANAERVHLIPTSTGATVTRYTGDPKLQRVTYQTSTNDGTKIATGHMNGLIVIWDAATGKEVTRLDSHTQSISCLLFDKKGKNLVSCAKAPPGNPRDDDEPMDRPSELKLWDVEKGTVTRNFDNARQSSVMLLDKDEKKILTGSIDGQVRTYELSTGKLLSSFINNDETEIRGMWWDADDKRLWTVTLNGFPKLWKGFEGAMEKEFELNASGAFHRALPTPDGKRLVASNRLFSRGVTIYEFATKTRKDVQLPGPSGEMCFSPDGKILFVATGYFSNDVSPGAGGWPKFTSRSAGVTFEDGLRVVAPTTSATTPTSFLSAIDMESGDLLWSISGTRYKPAGVTLTADGKKMVLTSSGPEFEMLVYPLETLMQYKTLKFSKPVLGHALIGNELLIIDAVGIASYPLTVGAAPTWKLELMGLNGDVQVTPDDKTILVRSGEGYLVLDNTGKKIVDLTNTGFASLSHDGKQVLVLQAGECNLLELPTLNKVLNLKDVPGELTAATFDRDGKKLYLSSKWSATRIYDLENKKADPIGTVAQTEKGSQGVILAGDALLRARSTEGIYLHDLQTGMPTASGGKMKLSRLGASLDGQWIVTGEGAKSYLWKR